MDNLEELRAATASLEQSSGYTLLDAPLPLSPPLAPSDDMISHLLRSRRHAAVGPITPVHGPHDARAAVPGACLCVCFALQPKPGLGRLLAVGCHDVANG